MPITILATVLAFQDRHTRSRKIGMFALVACGLLLILNSAFNVIGNTSQFLDSENLSNLYVAPFLSLIFIPFLYLLYLIVSYENIFSRVPLFIKDKDLVSYSKSCALTSFTFDVFALREWFRITVANAPQSRRGVQETLRLTSTRVYRSRRIRKENACGWTINSVRELLVPHGIKTQPYRSSQIDPDVWLSMSNMVDIGSGQLPLPNNIAYYIEGEELVVNELKLKLNVNIPSDARLAKQVYGTCAQVLASEVAPSVSYEKIDRIIEKESCSDVIDGDVRLTFERTDFTGTIPDGYSLVFTLKCIKN